MSGKRIAVITARADAGEQKEILLGISGAAMSAGADTVVFSNIYNHWVRDDMLNFENIIYALFDPGLFDGVIITAEAFMDISVLEDVIKSVRDYGITAVVIDGEIDGFMSVSSNDAGDMEQIAEHLISVHHFTDIDILAGKKDDPTSQRRISGCIRAFERHGTTIDPSKIHHGNYWTDSGEELAERYINGELPFPEAVICANDHMAYGLCDRLIEAGVDIPGRITVTGYDHTGGRLLHYPFLTTFRRSRREMGRRAVELILNSARKADEDNRFIRGNTCPCGADGSQLAAEITDMRIDQYHMMGESVAQFASHLTLCRTLSEYVSALCRYSFLIHYFSSFKLFLDADWNHSQFSGKEFICCDISDSGDRLPETISGGLLTYILEQNDKPRAVYLSPLVFQKRLFGYSAIAYDYPAVYEFGFRDWLKNAANAIEFLRIKNDIHYLSECQRASALYDSLTGFNDADAFRKILEEYSGQCFLTAVKLSFTSDGTYLYGENYRSDIISAAAKAIKQACSEYDVPCRYNEDTMMMILVKSERKVFEKRLKVMFHYFLDRQYDKRQVAVTTAVSENLDVDGLYANICNAAASSTHSFTEAQHTARYSELLDIRKAVRENPTKIPGLDEVSRNLCVSEGYFRSIYKKLFGISYNQDCTNAKITRACWLLCTTAMSVYAVARSCGYADEKFFTRQFKKATGYPPVQYQNRYTIS